MKLEFSRQILENAQVFSSMKIRLLEAELLHADRRTDRRDEADSRFPQFCKLAYKREETRNVCCLSRTIFWKYP